MRYLFNHRCPLDMVRRETLRQPTFIRLFETKPGGHRPTRRREMADVWFGIDRARLSVEARDETGRSHG